MNASILLRELRRIAIENNHRCFGCGFEHVCGIHGCAIIREAVERIEKQTIADTNDPLTSGELREMVGQWVWVTVRYERCDCAGWAFIPTPAYIAYLDQTISTDFCGKKFKAYRRRPEEAAHEE